MENSLQKDQYICFSPLKNENIILSFIALNDAVFLSK
jgi:hypothetical protein